MRPLASFASDLIFVYVFVCCVCKGADRLLASECANAHMCPARLARERSLWSMCVRAADRQRRTPTHTNKPPRTNTPVLADLSSSASNRLLPPWQPLSQRSSEPLANISRAISLALQPTSISQPKLTLSLLSLSLSKICPHLRHAHSTYTGHAPDRPVCAPPQSTGLERVAVSYCAGDCSFVCNHNVDDLDAN